MEKENEEISFTFPDNRMVPPICYKDKRNGVITRLQQTEIFKHNRKEYQFLRPSNVGLFVNISLKELKLSQNIFNKFINKKMSNSNKILFEEKELTLLYDYFEHIQTSIIFSYTAVESFSNAAIPNNFSIDKINNRGILEIWDKNNIEKWYPTSQKLIEILPLTLASNNIKNSKHWDDFLKLEIIRNEIIHLKDSDKIYNIDNSFFQKFFHKNIFRIIESGFNIIKFYSDNIKASFFIPIQLGNKKVNIFEIDDPDNYFHLEQVK